MKNKLGYILVGFVMLLLPIISVNALELKNTKSNCTLSESECSKNPNCVYIKSKNCGVIATENVNYTCYYKYYNNPSTVFLKAQFNKSGLISVEVDHDIPGASKQIGKPHPTREPITQITKNDRITYYTCPATLTEYKIEDVTINGMNTTNRYYTPIIYELTNHSITFQLLKDSTYNGVMGILSSNASTTPSEPTRQPLECQYSYNKNNVQVSLTVTYVDENTITVTELISANSGNSGELEFDTSYIKKSEEFKNWKCAPKNKIYVADDGKKKYISYNEEDLKHLTKYPSQLEGNQNDNTQNDSEFNPGTPIYGCQVIPDEIRDWIRDALNLVKYIALAIVIVLGVLDFLKAAGTGEAETMKKSGSDFLKRIIAVIILFLVPLIVDLILNLIEIFGADSTCI